MIVGGLAFTSCSKSEECECTVDGVTETITEDDVDGEDLEEACDALDALYTTFGGGSCEMV